MADEPAEPRILAGCAGFSNVGWYGSECLIFLNYPGPTSSLGECRCYSAWGFSPLQEELMD
jgi:hypothetical protein